MPKKTRKTKQPLTDRARHARFVKTAREVEADESPEAFDRAFKKVVGKKRTASRP
jgi:hypothetical protein